LHKYGYPLLNIPYEKEQVTTMPWKEHKLKKRMQYFCSGFSRDTLKSIRSICNKLKYLF